MPTVSDLQYLSTLFVLQERKIKAVHQLPNILGNLIHNWAVLQQDLPPNPP